MLHNELVESGAGASTGGKWTQLASSFAQGGISSPPPPGSLTLQAYEPIEPCVCDACVVSSPGWLVHSMRGWLTSAKT